MLKEYKIQTILGVWGGILSVLVGYYLSQGVQAVYVSFGRLTMTAGYVLFICGCFMYAKGKGRSFYWGITGLFGPLGLLLIYLLKDRSKIILKKRQRELS